MDPWIKAALWGVLFTLIFALAAYLAFRWLALRIARRLAMQAEVRLASSLTVGTSRASARFGRGPGRADAAARQAYLARVERLARLMDRLIPLPFIGGIGLDPILGLIPVAGDVTSLLIASFVILRAAQLGAPPEIVSRLIAVQCIDLLVGAVPFIGDLADAGYHANDRSVEIIKEWQRSIGEPTSPTE
jgi:hypothetical protein